MAGKDHELKGGFGDDDLIKAINYISKEFDKTKKKAEKPIKINIGGFVKEFTKEFDEVDRIITKRKASIDKKVINYTPQTQFNLRDIELWEETQKKIERQIAKAKMKYGLPSLQTDSFSKQLYAREKLFAKLGETNATQKELKEGWMDDAPSISKARANIELLQQQIDLKEKILQIDAKVKPFLPKSDWSTRFKQSDIDEQKEALKEAKILMARELYVAADKEKTNLLAELKEYEKSADKLMREGKVPDDFIFPDISSKFNTIESSAQNYLKTLGLIKEKTSEAKDSSDKQLASSNQLFDKYGATAEEVFMKIDKIFSRANDNDDGFYGLSSRSISELTKMMALLEHLSGGDLSKLTLEGDEFFGFQDELKEIQNFLKDEFKVDNSLENVFKSTTDQLNQLEATAEEAAPAIEKIGSSLNPDGDESKIEAKTDAIEELTKAIQHQANTEENSSNVQVASDDTISNIERTTEAIIQFTEAKKEHDRIADASPPIDSTIDSDIGNLEKKTRAVKELDDSSEKQKQSEIALQKELLFLDERENEYWETRKRLLQEGVAQQEAYVNTRKEQESNYSQNWIIAETDKMLSSYAAAEGKISGYGKAVQNAQNKANQLATAWESGSISANKYETEIAKINKALSNKNYNITGAETGVFSVNPNSIITLEKEMRALALATEGVVPESIAFNEQSKRMSYESKDATGNISKYSVAINSLNNELLRYQTKTIQSIGPTQEFFNFLSQSFKKVSSYVFSFGSFYRLWSELKNGISIIRDIDDSMTELKKVSEETAYTYSKFQKQAAAEGRIVAQTTSDMVQATADWKKMGYDLQESLGLAKASSLYVNVGDDVNITEATSDLVSTIKAFNLNADDSIGIVDRLNAVSNNFAVTSKDLGNILNHSSSSLATANTSLDKTIAMGAAMNEVLQDSSVSGSTLKVLSMRLRGAKVELEAAGESTDGMAESTSKLREKLKALTDIAGLGGFDIMKDDNTFKDVYEMMDGIAAKWKYMDDISRAGLLELIAGKMRAQGVSALLNNWSEAEAILKTSLESSGSAAKENETYINSITGRVKQLQAQYQELWQTTLNDDAIKFFIELATNVTQFATDMGGLLPVVATFGTLLAGIKYAGKEIRNRDNECALLINAA